MPPSPAPTDAHNFLPALREFIAGREDWLMERILEYAMRYGYARYTSTLIEPWRLSVCGLSAPLLAALDRGESNLELNPDLDYRHDPVAAFGIEEGRRHRERGVDIAMFLGLFKYYRQAYLDLLAEAPVEIAHSAPCRQFLERFFDRVELGLCKEWADGGAEQHLHELQTANRTMTNEKNKYLTLFESLADPVVLLDQDLRVDNLNQAAARLLHLGGNRYYEIADDAAPPPSATNAEPLRGLPAAQVMPCLELELKHFADNHGTAFECSKELTTADGPRYFLVRFSAMQDISGKYTGTLLIFDDQTELHLTEEQALRAKEAAEAANRAKSEFLANMSHELRTPLNSILGFSQLLRNSDNLSVAQQEELALIARSGEHLLTLINQVLDLAKIESGLMSLNLQSFDLVHMLAEVEDIFRLQAEQKGLRLLYEHGDDLPRYVHADEVKLRQILFNLLSNAIKFTREGGVSIRVRTCGCTEGGNICLDFEIEDSGPGIADDELDKIFQPFVQTRSGKALQQGTGLGLSLSRRFVKLMGGEMALTSTPGHGTLFKFWLLAQPAMSRDIIAKPRNHRVLGLEQGQPEYRILVVDDRADNRQLLIRLLAPLGFIVREAGNGLEALEAWEEWSPHLIWMDMRMPIMDGYEATRRIKATIKGHATVVVALTASAFEEQHSVVLSTGCDDFLRKPFQLTEILDLLQKHLGVRFYYSESSSRPAPRAARDWQHADLRNMPPAWFEAFRDAVETIDPERAEALLGQTDILDPQSADILRELLENYRFDALQKILEETPVHGQ